MSLFSLILGTVVFVYTVFYVIKTVKPLLRYKRADKIKVVKGRIIKKIDEENKTIGGELVNISMPCFEYKIDGEKRTCQSSIYYSNVKLGQTTDIAFNERTCEAWIIQDVQKIQKNLILKVLIIGLILAILVATEILV